ncbi:unnamed protein product [Penicillium nalgiovense]|nr:unnamed protein product [Penicillium nalgiovense]
MVGSRKSGSMENNENERWRGFRIDQITNKVKISVPHLLPNIFTVNAGSNDCVQNFEIDTAGERISEMLEYLWTTSSGSTSSFLLSFQIWMERLNHGSCASTRNFGKWQT